MLSPVLSWKSARFDVSVGQNVRRSVRNRRATAAARAANERLATDPPREPVAHLVERREMLQRNLARAERAERDAARALDTLGPIRRHTRGARLSLALEDAQRRTTSLSTEIATLERSIRARQIEIGERVRARRHETPAPGRTLDRPVDIGHGIDR
ncbi:MAG: hypothetical protein ABI317_10790 [Gaiellales bacterium]